MNNTVENDLFSISQGKVATSERWGGQICKIFTLNFLRIYQSKIIKTGLFWQSYLKITGGRFEGQGVDSYKIN